MRMLDVPIFQHFEAEAIKRLETVQNTDHVHNCANVKRTYVRRGQH